MLDWLPVEIHLRERKREKEGEREREREREREGEREREREREREGGGLCSILSIICNLIPGQLADQFSLATLSTISTGKGLL